MRTLKVIITLLLLLAISGCAGKQVTRLDESMVTDLSGRWNDTDSRLVAEEMISDCLNRPWLTRFKTGQNRAPVVVVGNIYNKTREHISEDTFIKDLERAYINSGLVEVVQSGAARDDIRKERADQNEFASEETRSRWKKETGADFMLSGTINAIEDRAGKKMTIFYQVDLELNDMESNQKVWIGDKKIKKLVEN